MFFGILILYVTHTKNYAKADFGSHNYESDSRYLYISRFVRSFLIFRELDNIYSSGQNKVPTAEWKSCLIVAQ